MIRALRLAADQTLELEEARAREEAAGAALARLDQLARDPCAGPGADRAPAVDVHAAGPALLAARAWAPDDGSAAARAAYRRLRHETLTAERRVLIALRDQGVISDEVLHRLEQELDVEAMRIGLGEVRLDDGSDARA